MMKCFTIIESLDKIKSYIALFDRKLEGSGEKDKKEFIFWLEKLKKVISIFEIFIDPTIPDEHIVDFLSLFPTNQREGIQTVFSLCKTLNQLATSKVKFAVSSKSKSLYDFSRCFVEGKVLCSKIVPTCAVSLKCRHFRGTL